MLPGMSSVDPNWLPSTLAQSTAALVAIVGGFLVGRLVSLAGEATALAHRLDELDERRRLRAAALLEVHRERLDVSEQWFREHHLEDFVRAEGAVDVDAAVESFIPLGSSAAEMRPYAATLADAVREAFDLIRQLYPAPKLPPRKFPHAVDELAGVPQDVYEQVAGRLIDQRRSRVLPFQAMISSPRGDVIYRRQDARIAREEELRAEVTMLEAERVLLDDQRSRMARPEGVRGGLIVLGLFAALGVVFPMIVMSLRPVPSGPGVRVSLILAFVVGFVALTGYMVSQVRTLRTRAAPATAD
ncbi:hypothetical protein CLV56_2829 [Mumia flava]|uniref:Uncharacterized protein n=1 Tax=Mumia flava TaxID=1348852 RepID=A0A0B2BW59_9ACTN|nr:hypothetical protein [Mumia flava]PJJ58578.1 hypothetical protein CLV56_2829 [Mumia flava]